MISLEMPSGAAACTRPLSQANDFRLNQILVILVRQSYELGVRTGIKSNLLIFRQLLCNVDLGSL